MILYLVEGICKYGIRKTFVWLDVFKRYKRPKWDYPYLSFTKFFNVILMISSIILISLIIHFIIKLVIRFITMFIKFLIFVFLNLIINPKKQKELVLNFSYICYAI